MVKAIIFDFFGVIRTDAVKSWLTLHNYELKGGLLTAVQKLDRGDIGSDEFLDTLSQITGQLPAEIFEEMERGAALDHDVLELISLLKPRYKMSLLSNSPSAFLRNILHEHRLDPYFDSVVISSEVGLIKPQPEIFKLALEKLGASPDETIFIDDNANNVTAGKAIGLTGIVYKSADQLKTDLRALGLQF